MRDAFRPLPITVRSIPAERAPFRLSMADPSAMGLSLAGFWIVVAALVAARIYVGA